MIDRLRTLPNRPLLFALIVADLMFIFVGFLNLLPAQYFPFFQNSAFNISRDAGVAEGFQYVKELWIVLIFFWLVFYRRRPALLGFALLFTYLMLDDMIMIHEKFGDLAAGLFTNLPVVTRFTHLQPDDFGELFYIGIFGLVIVGLLYLFYRRGNMATRRVSQTLFIMLGALLFFGVVVDFLADSINARIIREIAQIFEDGGEMLVTSVICWYAWSLIGEARIMEEEFMAYPEPLQQPAESVTERENR